MGHQRRAVPGPVLDQQVEPADLLVMEDRTVGAAGGAGRHYRDRVLAVVNAVAADGAEHAAAGVRLVLELAASAAVGVERVVAPVVVDEVAGADGALPGVAERYRQGVALPVDQVGGGEVGVLVRAQVPLAGVVAPVEQVEQVQPAAVPQQHAVARVDVVAARPPVVRHRALRPQDLDRALRGGRRAAAEAGDLGVAQGALPQRHVVHLTVEAGTQPALFPGRADQERRLEAMQGAVAPLLIDQHAVDEQLQVRSAEAKHHVVPGRRPDQRHRHAYLQHAGAGIGEDTVGGGPAFAEPDHRVVRPGAPAILQQRARTGQPAGSPRFSEQVVPGGGRPRFRTARVAQRPGRAVGAGEDGAEGVAGVVAGEQGRVPAAGAVAQPHAERHGVAPQAVSRQPAALDPEVAAGKFRHGAVAAAGERRLALGAGQRDAEPHRAGERQLGSSPAAARGHVPGNQRVSQRLRGAHASRPLLIAARSYPVQGRIRGVLVRGGDLGDATSPCA